MALAAATVWEVRTAGSDSNGGGFVAGASGTDRSQQDSAQGSGTNLTVDATTNTDVTPDGYSVSSADVGNIIQITTTGAGAAFTVGFYEIKSIQGGTKWRLDRSPAATSSAGASWSIGGALLTASKAAGAMVGSNTVYVKGPGTFQITTTITPPTGAQATPTRWIGYNATRGDLDSATSYTNFPTIQVNNAAIVAFTYSNPWQRIRNFILDGAGGATKGTRGVNATANYCNVDNVKVTGFSAFGIVLNGINAWGRRCWVTGMASGATAALFGGVAAFYEMCLASANPCYGFQANNMHRCVADGQTGASSHGFFCSSQLGAVRHCVSRNNGGSGIAHSGGGDSLTLVNNILVGNSRYGIENAGTALIDQPSMNYNAFYNNTSGAVTGQPAGPNDVTLSGDPFTNAASGDYSLNTTAGAGAACRAAGSPGTWAGLSGTTGYVDIGYAQHADPATSTVVRFPASLGGGLV